MFSQASRKRTQPGPAVVGQWGPTMRDLADVLGVHPSTVSLALRDAPGVSAATKLKVRQCAERLGYRPDPELVLFNAKRHSGQTQVVRGAIGFVTDLPTLSELRRHEALGCALESLGAAARRVGYSVDVFHLGPGLRAILQLRRVLEARSIQSIVLGMVQASGRLEGFDPAHFHGVRIESFQLDSSFDLVTPDHPLATRLCMRALHKQRRTRPGLLLNENTPRGISELRSAGYMSEWARQNEDWPPLPFFLSTEAKAAAAKSLVDWFKAGAFDSVVCESPVLPGVFETHPFFRAKRVPYACLDLRGKEGQVAGVDTLRSKVGEAAMKLLLTTLGADGALFNHSKPTMTFTPVQWRDGESLHSARP